MLPFSRNSVCYGNCALKFDDNDLYDGDVQSGLFCPIYIYVSFEGNPPILYIGLVGQTKPQHFSLSYVFMDGGEGEGAMYKSSAINV